MKTSEHDEEGVSTSIHMAFWNIRFEKNKHRMAFLVHTYT